MEKEEFNKLEIAEQVQYVNNEISNGNALKPLSKSMGFGNSTLSDRFKTNGYILNPSTKLYGKNNTLVMEIHQSNTKELPQTQESIKTVHESNKKEIPIPKEKPNKDLKKYESDIKALLNYKDDILVMLEEYKSNTKQYKGNTLDINSLPSEYISDIANKSIKASEGILNLFDSLCNEYGSYKKQDLISLALYEFCLKYKK